jgi:hypothetical protein
VSTKVKFINHASVQIHNNEVSLLSDPWYFGSVFNEGWTLNVEQSDDEIQNILKNTTHIWISNYHTYHLSIPLFKKYRDIILKNKIIVMFQKTRDGRVKSFFENLGFNLQELDNGFEFKIAEQTKICCLKKDTYDSMLHFNDNEVSILNLNDCPVRSLNEIEKLKQRFGAVDVLLTQFSYAAWKGGRANIDWRNEAAAEKITTMDLQAQILGSKIVIPFASFARFANVENFYMNDAANSPNKVLAKSKITDKIFFLSPFDEIDLSNPINNSFEAAQFWEAAISNANSQPFIRSKSYEINEIMESFESYKGILYQNNSLKLIKLVKLLPFIGFFKDLLISLNDLGITVRLNIASGVIEKVEDAPDVVMHSSSLKFIFDHVFGFDTLLVNSRFEEGRQGGFSAMAKTFGLASLNAAGIFLNHKIIFNANLIKKLWFSLINVRRKTIKPIVKYD